MPHLRRRLLLATTCLVGLGSFMPVAIAGGVTGFSGQGGTLSQPDAQTTIIHQTAPKAIFNYSSFDIAPGSSVIFQQPSSSAIALNRVQGTAASQLGGTLSANGNVWIVNANGVMIGPQAQINVGGFLATTSDIADSDFLAGTYKFGTPSANRSAAIVNQGTIRTAAGGTVVLAAPRVDNQGLIVAEAGTVVLAGGKAFALDFDGDHLLSFQVTVPVDAIPLDDAGNPVSALVSNSGTISATGGKVLLTARAAKNVINNVINTSGIIEASSAHLENGEVVLDGGDVGAVQVSGTLDASGTGAGETGGKVRVVGETVSLAASARVDVSGDVGGGVAEIGGGVHGSGGATAQTTLVAGGAWVNADALSSGNGGSIAIWSEQFTDVAGTLSARGGAISGNGGFIETSSHGALGIEPGAVVSTAAPHGTAGEWLLDPFNLTITNATANVNESVGQFSPSASGATVDAAAIDAALNAGTSVAVFTNTPPGGEAGDISVNAPITMSASPGTTPTLTLKAAGSVFVNQPITTTGGPLAVTIDSGALGPTGSINLAADIVADQISLNANGSINQTSGILNTRGGTLTGNSLNGATLPGANLIGTLLSFANTGSGDVLVGNATSLQVAGPVNAGPGSLILSAATGTLVINGTVTAQTGFNFIANNFVISGGSVIGPGPRQISTATPGVAIDIGGSAAPAPLVIDSVSLSILDAGSPAGLAITGTGPINVVSPVTIDVPLTLIGSDVALGGLTKNVGPLFIGATGAVTGTVNLGPGTGNLSISSSSTNVTGTINGLSGAAGAAAVIEQPMPGAAGPFIVDGIAIASVPVARIVPLPPVNLIPIPPPATPQSSVASLPTMDPLAPPPPTPPDSAPAAASSEPQQASTSGAAGSPGGSNASEGTSSAGGSTDTASASGSGTASPAAANTSSAATTTPAAAAPSATQLAAAAVTVFSPIAPPVAAPVADPANGDGSATSGDSIAKVVAQPLQAKPAAAAEGKRPAATKVVIHGLVNGLQPPSGSTLPRGTTAGGDFSIWGNDARW